MPGEPTKEEVESQMAGIIYEANWRVKSELEAAACMVLRIRAERDRAIEALTQTAIDYEQLNFRKPFYMRLQRRITECKSDLT